MRIAFIMRSVVIKGGLERVMTTKMNWLAERGHEVILVTYEQGHHNLSFILSKRVIHVDLDCRYFVIFRYNLIKRFIEKLKQKRLFKTKLCDFINNHRPDVLVTPHNLQEFEDAITSMSTFVPVVWEFHSISKEIERNNRWWNKHLFYDRLRRCNLVVALTSKDAAFWGRKCDNVMALPNPLYFYPKKISIKNKAEGRIICVARFDPVKRIDRLIESFSLLVDSYPHWYIDLFGEGPEEKRIRRLVSEKKLDAYIHIHKPVDTICDEYQKSQMLVLASDQESFSLVIVEAMAWGLPVVSTNCPYGPGAIIENGVTGLLAEMDAADLANKISWLIDHEKERSMMGQNAYLAAAKYEKDRVMREWEKAYKSVI